MGLFSRDRDDRRSAGEVVTDIGHDLYHRAAKLDKDHPDGKRDWRHDGGCEFTEDLEPWGGR
jgi:hypothetical protein